MTTCIILALLALQAGAIITGQTACNAVCCPQYHRSDSADLSRYLCINGLHDSDKNVDTCALSFASMDAQSGFELG